MSDEASHESRYNALVMYAGLIVLGLLLYVVLGGR